MAVGRGIHVFVAVLVTMVVASCGSVASPSATPTAAPTPTPTAAPTPAPTPTPTAAPTPTPTPAPTPTAAPTPAPTPTPAPSATATPTPPAPTPAAGFSCRYPFERSATTSELAFIKDVRVGTHRGYDRIVVEFLGSGLPRFSVGRVKPPLLADPSGKRLSVPGSWFLQLRMVQASGAGYARPDGQPTYAGPSSFRPDYRRLVSLVQAGDFEGYTTWFAGLSGRMCYRVLALDNPARLVIDLRAP